MRRRHTCRKISRRLRERGFISAQCLDSAIQHLCLITNTLRYDTVAEAFRNISPFYKKWGAEKKSHQKYDAMQEN
uniref:Uncharacterized protein n=1 Tax=Parascaris univalens TaxID=6257 RepID=A0A914ZK96_PARUN